MKKRIAAALAAALLMQAGANAQNMTISPNGSRPAATAPADHFVGNVTLEPIFAPKPTLQATGGLVTFAPGAHSDWHSHPGGQLLIVTAGMGWVQEEGGPKREIKAGDVIWTPPGIKHWHGATPTTSMSHIAITDVVNGNNTDWLDKVSEDEYRK